MNRTQNSSRPTESIRGLKNDLLASVVVFLVALPLCMGIAIASGAPPETGIITGIVGGLVVGLLAGCPLQVSGPAAGLTVVVYQLIQEHGLEMLGIIVLGAGLIQIVAGLLRLGQWFRAVSPAVIQGMLAGIGVLIFASQFHVMVDDSPRGNGIENLLSIPEAVWKGLVPLDGSSHHLAAQIGVLTIGVLALWKMLMPKKLKVIPAPLAAVVLATAVVVAFGLPIKLVDMPGNLLAGLRMPRLEDLALLTNGALVGAAFSVAFIASAETLLCATAVDQMQTGPRTRYDKELWAQGVGNTVCGLLGALPMTGVIVRSAANIEAGARTRLSTVLHGAWLLALVALFPQVLRLIPTASLAAILVFTGYKLMNVKALRELGKYGWSEVVIYAATVVMIVATDLLTGVLVGVGLSLLKLLYLFSHLGIRLEADPVRGRTVLYLEGTATFIRLPKLAAVLENVPGNTELHVHIEGLSYIDHACLDLLMNWEKQHEATGGSLVIDWDSLTARFRQFGLNGNKASRPRATHGHVLQPMDKNGQDPAALPGLEETIESAGGSGAPARPRDGAGERVQATP